MTTRPASPASNGYLLLRGRRRYGDTAFRSAVIGAAGLVVVVLVAMAAFLVAQSLPALRHYGPPSFLGSDRWAPSDALTYSTHPNPYGIVQFIYGTVLTWVIGMLIAVSMSVGIGLFITGIAPAWLCRPCHTWWTCSRRSHRWGSGSGGSSRSSRSCSRPRAS